MNRFIKAILVAVIVAAIAVVVLVGIAPDVGHGIFPLG